MHVVTITITLGEQQVKSSWQDYLEQQQQQQEQQN